MNLFLKENKGFVISTSSLGTLVSSEDSNE